HEGVAGDWKGADFTVSPGDTVSSDEQSGGDVLLPDGVRLTLHPTTRLRVPDRNQLATAASAPAHERVTLEGGAIAVQVPPMSAGHTFSIATPDTVATVHGTSFTVEVDPPAESPSTSAPRTRVRVTSGVVSVANGDRETFLTAGMQWPSRESDSDKA